MKRISLVLTMISTINATNSTSINPLYDDSQSSFNPVFKNNIRVLRWRMLLAEVSTQEIQRLKSNREPKLATIEEGPIDFSFEIERALEVLEKTKD